MSRLQQPVRPSRVVRFGIGDAFFFWLDRRQILAAFCMGLWLHTLAERAFNTKSSIAFANPSSSFEEVT
jgi:hypothetical protein